MSMLDAIPGYSDLGKADSHTRNTWDARLQAYARYEYYFSGEVFGETVKDSELADPPLLYPVGINVVKLLCQSLSDATFGEWDNLPLWYATRRGVVENTATQEASALLDRVLFQSDAESTLLEMELQRMLYGASVLKIRPSLRSKGVEWLPVKPPSFFPVFNPHNRNQLIEAHTSKYLSKAQAKAFYGYMGKKDEVLLEEHWDLHKHELVLDGKHRIPKFSGRNPYGLIPFVYIPRMRSTSTFGDAITDDIIPVQDELNMRVADVGDAINFNAHPTRWGLNMPLEFNSENYPIGSDVMWDIGRSFGEHHPEIGLLEVKNPVPGGVLEHIQWLYDWVRTSTFAPPIAFGEDNGGGQRSGITLEIRMFPLIRAVKKHRAYLRTGMRHAAYITGRILEQKDFSRPQVRRALMDGDVEPYFADIMPRDRAKEVDEVVKRLSTVPPTISLEAALKTLGADSIEEERIEEMVKKYGLDQNGQESQAKDSQEAE